MLKRRRWLGLRWNCGLVSELRTQTGADPTAHLDAAFPNDVLHFQKCNGGGMESAITSKGQATIPKAIREHLRLKPGDRVKFFVHPDGSVVLLPKLPASALRGIVKSRRRAVTLEEMSEAAAAGASEAAARRRRR